MHSIWFLDCSSDRIENFCTIQTVTIWRCSKGNFLIRFLEVSIIPCFLFKTTLNPCLKDTIHSLILPTETNQDRILDSMANDCLLIFWTIYCPRKIGIMRVSSFCRVVYSHPKMKIIKKRYDMTIVRV